MSAIAQQKRVAFFKIISDNFRRHTAIVVVCLLLFIALIGAIIATKHKDKQAQINRPNLDALNSAYNCQKGLAQTNQERPNPKQISSSIALLSFRASCLSEAGRYNEAISMLYQLKAYYLKENDTNDATTVDGEIADEQYNLKHPVPLTSSLNKTAPNGVPSH